MIETPWYYFACGWIQPDNLDWNNCLLIFSNVPSAIQSRRTPPRAAPSRKGKGPISYGSEMPRICVKGPQRSEMEVKGAHEGEGALRGKRSAWWRSVFSLVPLTNLFPPLNVVQKSEIWYGSAIPICWNLGSWFSGKSLKLLPPDVRFKG